MQLDAAIGAAAFLEFLWIECVVFSVVSSELADDVSNRDGNALARWITLMFSNIDDLNVDIFRQVRVLSDVKLRFWSWATRCAASRRWPTPE